MAAFRFTPFIADSLDGYWKRLGITPFEYPLAVAGAKTG
jgi:hypothetical protein